jgi:hypothetical protein
MRRLIYLLIVLLAGCGTEMNVDITTTPVEPPPSNIRSAGAVSGGTYAEGGEHYKAISILGNNMGSEIQTSANGRYQVK